jgi:hypothetical protein
MKMKVRRMREISSREDRAKRGHMNQWIVKADKELLRDIETVEILNTQMRTNKSRRNNKRLMSRGINLVYLLLYRSQMCPLKKVKHRRKCL